MDGAAESAAAAPAPAADADEAAFGARVLEFYQRHNPTRVDVVPEIVEKYKDRPETLWAKLDKKYGGAATGAFLDFRSKSFDARAALRTPGLRPPVPNAPPLDNISKFRPFLPASSAERDDRVKHGPSHHPRPRPGDGVSGGGRATALLATITDPLREGPYSLLWRAVRDRARVRVTLRRINSIRGVCAGLLKAFDRHMNLVLTDVDETTTPKRRNPARARPVHRHLPQVLVRGDNVVLVAFEPPGAPRGGPVRR